MKISIIGAGPAGTIVGASASEENRHVTIYEEHKQIGLPENCGGLLSKKAVSWFKDIGVNTSSTILNKIKDIEITSGKSIMFLPSKETRAFVVKRGKFDQSCAEFAEKKGARIKHGKRLKYGDIENLHSNSFIIGADGPFSTVAKTFKFPEIQNYAVAYQKDVTNLNLNNEERHLVRVYLHEKAFGWLIPINDERAHVGLLFFRNPEIRKFDWFLDAIRSKLDKKSLKTENFFSDCIPFSVRPQIQKKNVYLVGDAAGQVKATSGGGIYYGCKSAWLAGKTIETEDYEKRWRKEIGKSLDQHLFLRKTINSLNPNIISSIIYFTSLFGLKNLLSKYDMENISSLVGL